MTRRHLDAFERWLDANTVNVLLPILIWTTLWIVFKAVLRSEDLYQQGVLEIYFNLAQDKDAFTWTNPWAAGASENAPSFMVAIARLLVGWGFDPDSAGHQRGLAYTIIGLSIGFISGALFNGARALGASRVFSLIAILLGTTSILTFHARITDLYTALTDANVGMLALAISLFALGLFVRGRISAALIIATSTVYIHALAGPIIVAFMILCLTFEALKNKSVNALFRLFGLAITILIIAAPYFYRIVVDGIPTGVADSKLFFDYMQHRTGNTLPFREGLGIFLAHAMMFWVAFHLLQAEPGDEAAQVQATFRARFVVIAMMSAWLLQCFFTEVIQSQFVSTLVLTRSMSVITILLAIGLAINFCRNCRNHKYGVWIPIAAALVLWGLSWPNVFGAITVATKDPTGQYIDFAIILLASSALILRANRAENFRRFLGGAVVLLLLLLGTLAVNIWLHSESTCTDRSTIACATDLFRTGWAQFGKIGAVGVLTIAASWFATRTFAPALMERISWPSAVVGGMILAFVAINTLHLMRVTSRNETVEIAKTELLEFVEKNTSVDDLLFVPFEAPLTRVRAQYVDWKWSLYIVYSKQGLEDLRDRLAAMGIFMDDRSASRQACSSLRILFTYRCMVFANGIDRQIERADWRAHLSDMKATAPTLSKAVIYRRDVTAKDRVVAQNDLYAVLDLR